MRAGLVAFSVLALAASPALAQFKGKGDSATKYGWLPSIEAGKAEAKRTGKPMFVALRCVP